MGPVPLRETVSALRDTPRTRHRAVSNVPHVQLGFTGTHKIIAFVIDTISAWIQLTRSMSLRVRDVFVARRNVGRADVYLLCLDAVSFFRQSRDLRAERYL